jgi:amidase
LPPSGFLSVADLPTSLYQLKKIGGRQAKLSFGFYEFDGLVHCNPPVRRAIAMLKTALEKAGHEVIQWEPRTNAGVDETANAIFACDGGADFRAVSKDSGEASTSLCIRVNSLWKQPLHPDLRGRLENKELSVTESWQLTVKRDQLRKQALDQWLETASQTSTSRPIDALFCAVKPYPAPLHSKSLYYGYTAAFNLLDWPALAMPVTQVDPSKDLVDEDFQAVSDVDQQVHDAYDPKTFAGLPVGIQLVGRRFREEELLGLAEIVAAALKAA